MTFVSALNTSEILLKLRFTEGISLPIVQLTMRISHELNLWGRVIVGIAQCDLAVA